MSQSLLFLTLKNNIEGATTILGRGVHYKLLVVEVPNILNLFYRFYMNNLNKKVILHPNEIDKEDMQRFFSHIITPNWRVIKNYNLDIDNWESYNYLNCCWITDYAANKKKDMFLVD
jgi:hypothetical protein